jgi:hypothetical protein
MSGARQATPADRATASRIMRALRMVTVPLPHLLALPQPCVSILTFACRQWAFSPPAAWLQIRPLRPGSGDDLVFVLAHESYTWPCDSRPSQRQRPGRIHHAHDYIINDSRGTRRGHGIPAGGLDMPGARESVEELAPRCDQ